MAPDQLIIDVAKLLFQVQRSNSNHSDVDCVLPYRFFDEQTSYFKDGKSKIGKSLVFKL